MWECQLVEHQFLFPFLVSLIHAYKPVFRAHNGVDAGSEYFDVVFLKDVGVVKFHAAVESRLTAELKQDSIGTLVTDHLLHVTRSDRKEIYFVRQACIERLRCLRIVRLGIFLSQ